MGYCFKRIVLPEHFVIRPLERMAKAQGLTQAHFRLSLYPSLAPTVKTSLGAF
uniref:Uncharacterized protein n=1 Tax=Anguilla anguilla TaxID=7936 RepID=A0A0E9WKX7_ANGAN